MSLANMMFGRAQQRLVLTSLLALTCYIVFSSVFTQIDSSDYKPDQTGYSDHNNDRNVEHLENVEIKNVGELETRSTHTILPDELVVERLDEEQSELSVDWDAQLPSNLNQDPDYIATIFEPRLQSANHEADCAGEVDWGIIDTTKSKMRSLCDPIKGNFTVSAEDTEAGMVQSSIRCTCAGGQHSLEPLRTCEFRNIAIDWTKVLSPIRNNGASQKANTNVDDLPLPLDWKTMPAFFFKQGVVRADCRLNTDVGNQKLSILSGLKGTQEHIASKMVQATSYTGNNSAEFPASSYSMSQYCSPTNTYNHIVMTVSRRDDHCPFFAFSMLLNAFWVTKVYGVDPREVQILFMDRGHSSDLELPLNDIYQRFFPTYPILFDGQHTADIVRPRMSCYRHLISPPSEYEGPIMNHLTTGSNCKDSNLVKQFRSAVLKALNVEDPRRVGGRKRVTFIVRRDVKANPATGLGARVVSRKFLNEQALIDALTTTAEKKGFDLEVADMNILPMEEQARMFHDADVVIAFHGAGLVQALFMGPGQTLIEVMEQSRRRFSFQNICGYVGAHYRVLRTRGKVEQPSYDVDPALIINELNRLL
eukprot:CFRG6229T1